jgi:hypothetical protein
VESEEAPFRMAGLVLAIDAEILFRQPGVSSPHTYDTRADQGLTGVE